MERFWTKVQKGTGCWLWLGARDRKGYGICRFDGGTRRAARVVWADTHGAIPDGLLVCHHCDNPSCVRPDHLFLSTPKGNMLDMAAKGRGTPPPVHRGERHHKSRFTAEQVRELRNAHATGTSIYRLAKRAGAHESSVRAIVHGRVWTHV